MSSFQRVRYLPRVRMVAQWVGEVVTSPTPRSIEQTVEIWTTPHQLVLQPMTWRFPGGQAQISEPAGPARLVPLSEGQTLASALGPDLCEHLETIELQAFQSHIQRCMGAPAREWMQHVFSVLQPRHATGVESRVEPDLADFFELGASEDDRIPLRTLRLGRAHDELVLDHSFSWNGPRERTIVVEEVLDCGAPRDAERVESVFGTDIRRVAEWFARNRMAAFHGATP
jgi:hypothetical protein